MPKEQSQGVTQPTLYIQALKDNILTPDLAKGSECRLEASGNQQLISILVNKSIPNLTTGEVPASHWALWHTPQETNDIIKGWFEGVVFGGKSKL